MSSTVRLLIAALLAGVNVLLVPDIFGLLPQWVQIAVAVVSAVLLTILVPPQYVYDNPGKASAPASGNTIVKRE